MVCTISIWARRSPSTAMFPRSRLPFCCTFSLCRRSRAAAGTAEGGGAGAEQEPAPLATYKGCTPLSTGLATSAAVLAGRLSAWTEFTSPRGRVKRSRFSLSLQSPRCRPRRLRGDGGWSPRSREQTAFGLALTKQALPFMYRGAPREHDGLNRMGKLHDSQGLPGGAKSLRKICRLQLDYLSLLPYTR